MCRTANDSTLNLYSCDYHAFGPAETRTAQRLTEEASHCLFHLVALIGMVIGVVWLRRIDARGNRPVAPRAAKLVYS
jgi:hypothetical protein